MECFSVPIIKVLRSLFVVVLICKVLPHHHCTHTYLFIYKCIYMYALRSRQGKTFECVMCLRRGLPQQGMPLSFSPTFTYLLLLPFSFPQFFFFSLLILEGEGGSEIRAKKKKRNVGGKKKEKKKRGIAATSDMFVSFVLYCRRERKDSE